MRHPNGREPRRLYRLQVPAGTFDVKNFLLLADDVLLAHLHRGVASAMKDESVVAAKQSRGIDAQFQVGPACGRFGWIPKVLHRFPCIIGRARLLSSRT